MPRHSPNPMRAKPSRSQLPRMITSSLILEKLAGFTRRERERLGAAPGELEEAAAGILRRSGDGAAAEEITGGQVAPVRGVVRKDLCRRPVEISEP